MKQRNLPFLLRTLLWNLWIVANFAIFLVQIHKICQKNGHWVHCDLERFWIRIWVFPFGQSIWNGPCRLREPSPSTVNKEGMFYKGSRKKGLFFSGPATKALPPPSSVVATFFCIYFRASKKIFFLSSQALTPPPPYRPGHTA